MAFDIVDRLFGTSTNGQRTDPDGETVMSDEDLGLEEPPGDEPADGAVPTDEMAAEEDRVGDLDARIDELETELAQNDSTIRAIESNQEEIADSIDQLDDTVRRLLGVYDQLAATQNPFADGQGQRTHGEERFGLVEEPDAPAQPSDGAPGTTEIPDPGSRDEDTSGEAPEETVTIDDLLEEADGGEAPEPEEPPAAEESGPPTEADVDADEGATAPEGSADGAAHSPIPEATDRVGGSAGGDSAHLERLPEGYAADLLAMEWLASLVETSGPAGALKALAFYEELGWTSPEAADELESYLSVPTLDDDVDPNCPVELTASDHAESYQYVLRLQALESLDVAITESV